MSHSEALTKGNNYFQSITGCSNSNSIRKHLLHRKGMISVYEYRIGKTRRLTETLYLNDDGVIVNEPYYNILAY